MKDRKGCIASEPLRERLTEESQDQGVGESHYDFSFEIERKRQVGSGGWLPRKDIARKWSFLLRYSVVGGLVAVLATFILRLK